MILTPLVLLQKFLFGATAGVLIEFLFTGISSVLKGNLKATSCSYLWAPPVYGTTVLVLDLLRQGLGWPFWAMAPIYVAVFYLAEALSGLAIKAITGWLQARWPSFHGGGVVPWEYPKSTWAPAGLVNFKYLPFWLFLALLFDPIAQPFQKNAVFLAG